ncbi:leucine-rich repeat domain-containing protein [Adlercreutzia sp. ZJ141]|uniref:leucine-rich repeat domain-containing protein n=1 Tax=Adlercreutzia sp. ZJ141 TaxID=2709406 RepID=UPI0013EA021B|nr:leucine-rich repeat domain-containing protein [Adlercreutzia sp. ZJ141]
MFKTVFDYISKHATQFAGATAGLALVGMLGYVLLSGTLSLGFFDEMAWAKNVYKDDRVFGSVSYQVGEVDESDNRIHDDEDDPEGANDSTSDMLASDEDATDDSSASLAGSTVQTDSSTRVGSETTVVEGDGAGAQGGQGNAGNGGADNPSNPGGAGGEGEGEGGNPGGPSAPPITDYQAGQLSAKDDYVDEEYGTLVDLKVEVPEHWSFAEGESYNPNNVRVWAIYRQPDGTQHEVELPYGDGGYTAFLSPTWTTGQHDVTFSYKEKSVSEPFYVMGKRFNFAMGTHDGKDYYSARIPGLLSEPYKSTAVEIQEEAVSHDVIGGFFTDLSDAQRFLITVLGRQDVYRKYKKSTDKNYRGVQFLESAFSEGSDGYLKEMVAGFKSTDSANNDPTAEPLIYIPSEVDGKSTVRTVVSIVQEVPKDFRIRREEGQNKENPFLGDQVLAAYTGSGSEVPIPVGVTKVALECENNTVIKLVLPESVVDIDFPSITENFPSLNSIKVGDNNSQTFSSYKNVLYSANGLRMLYVPSCYQEDDTAPIKVMDFDAWSPWAEAVGEDAFKNCVLERVEVPTHVKTLEAGCLAGATIGKLVFASETPVAGIAKSGFTGELFVPDTEFDTACKQWIAALGGESAMKVGVLGNTDGSGSSNEGVAPGTYVYDTERGVVVTNTEPDVLAGVPAAAPEAYWVPDGITAIGAGAFAATPDIRDVVVPATVKELRANSLVGLSDGVHMTLSGESVVSIDAAAFGANAGDGSGSNIPDMTVAVPRELYAQYLREWGNALGDEVAHRLIEPADETYLYLNNAKYLVLDEAGTKLCLVDVFDEGQTFFEPDARTTQIASGSFSNCASLEIVHIPASVVSVDVDAFKDCVKLESVLVSGKLPVFPHVGNAQLLQPGNGVGYDYEPDTGAVYRADADGSFTLVNVPTDTTFFIVRANTTHLGDEAFKGSPTFDSIGFDTPETLISIGNRCFADCPRMDNVNYSELTSLTSIGKEAFVGCTALKEVILPDCVSQVGQGAFANCSSLTSFVAHGLAALDARTFSYCTALAYIDAPNVTSVGDECFYHCESLMTLKGAIKRFSSDGKAVYEDSFNLDELTWVGDRAFAYCLSFGYDTYRKLDLPALEHVGVQAFMGCPSLKEVVLPASLTELGEEAFRDCMALDTLHAQGALETIGRYSFYGCVSLAHLDVSDSQKKALKVIGACAFSRCVALERLDLSDYPNLSYLGDQAFEGCSGLLRITMPISLTEVSDRCFSDCPLLSIIEFAAENPTSLGTSVFGSKPSEYLRIWVPNEQAYAGYLEAYSAVLDPEYGEDYTLSILEVRNDNVEVLRGVTYQASEDGWIITDAEPSVSGTVMLADSVAAIAPGAFEGCDKIEKVQYEFGASISLGDRAFEGCSGLKEVQLNGSIDSWGDSVFANCSNLETVRIGGSQNDRIECVGPHAFENCTALSYVGFSAAVGSIGESAFQSCTSLVETGTVSSYIAALSAIGDCAFKGSGLKTFPISNSYKALKTIGKEAFADCDSLENGYVPEKVESLGEGCFAYCDNLQTTSIYGGLAEIPKDCFKGCPKLLRTGGTKAALADLKTIGESAFEGCISLELTSSWSLEKYKNLEYIGANAFKGAITHTQAGSGSKRVDTLTLSSTLNFIGSHAFDGCIGLSKVKLQSNPEMGEGAFANMRDGFVLEQLGQDKSASVTDTTDAAETAAASEGTADTTDAAQTGDQGADNDSNDAADAGGDDVAAGNGVADATAGAGGTDTATDATGGTAAGDGGGASEAGAVNAGADAGSGAAAATATNTDTAAAATNATRAAVAAAAINDINAANGSGGTTSSEGETA